MKKILVSLLLLASLQVFANPIDDSCPQHVIHGAPVSILSNTSTQYICRTGYAVHYDYSTKVSEYAVEKVTKASIVGKATRKDDFREDPSVPAQFRATLKDYQASGYDRGHMAPAADFYYSPEAMSESFYLTNMMPQVPGNNRGIWKYLETYTRAWAEAYGEAYVITGTIFSPSKAVIGNNVKVPSHVYKIVYIPSVEKVIAFNFPNEKLPVEDLPKYVVSVVDIESKTGLKFFPKLPLVKQSIKTQRANFKEWAGQ